MKKDPEVLDAVLEVMEVEKLLHSEASLDVLPSSSNVLIQLGDRQQRETTPIVTQYRSSTSPGRHE